MTKVELDLEQILDAVHAAVRIADFAAVAALTPRCADALAALPTNLHADDFARLREKARRNAQFLDAAGRGLRSAIRRLGELRDARDGLLTYDDRGKRADKSLAPSMRRRF